MPLACQCGVLFGGGAANHRPPEPGAIHRPGPGPFRARGPALVTGTFFLLLLVEFCFVLTFLKDARERGAHEDCQSPLLA